MFVPQRLCYRDVHYDKQLHMKVKSALRSRNAVYTPASDTNQMSCFFNMYELSPNQKIFRTLPTGIKENTINKKCICHHSINKLKNSKFEVQIDTLLMILVFLGIYHVLVVII